MPDPLILSDVPISLEDVVEVARNGRMVELDNELVQRLATTKAYINEHWLGNDAPLIYSLNTGVGAFKDQRVRPEDFEQYQKNLIDSILLGFYYAFS